MFRDEPGVLRSQLRTLRRGKRQNICLDLPESLVLLVRDLARLSPLCGALR